MYKILIVEDDNTIAERLASHLKKWNYKTVCVRDFKNVMEEFKKTDPQLVILDIGLPFYNFTMDSTGARRSGSCPMCRSSFCHR